MEFKAYKYDKYVLIYLNEIFFLDTNTTILNQIKSYVKKVSKDFIISFKKTKVLTSNGIRELLFVKKYLDKTDGKLFLVDVNDDIKNVFTVLMLNKVFTIFDDLDKFKKKYLK